MVPEQRVCQVPHTTCHMEPYCVTTKVCRQVPVCVPVCESPCEPACEPMCCAKRYGAGPRALRGLRRYGRPVQRRLVVSTVQAHSWVRCCPPLQCLCPPQERPHASRHPLRLLQRHQRRHGAGGAD